MGTCDVVDSAADDANDYGDNYALILMLVRLMIFMLKMTFLMPMIG